MIHFEDNLSAIGFDKDLDATFMTFKSNVTSKQFITTHEEVVNMLNDMGEYSGKHLVDCKPLLAISLEGQEWVADNVIPIIRKKGTGDKAKIALIMSDDVFGKFAVHNISKKADANSETHFFNTEIEAKDWLRSQ